MFTGFICFAINLFVYVLFVVEFVGQRVLIRFCVLCFVINLFVYVMFVVEFVGQSVYGTFVWHI